VRPVPRDLRRWVAGDADDVDDADDTDDTIDR
jgi:hypothetical protein